MKKTYRDLPVQVDSMIKNILNPKDSVFVRVNYYNRLADIRDAVTDALAEFDKDYQAQMEKTKTK